MKMTNLVLCAVYLAVVAVFVADRGSACKTRPKVGLQPDFGSDLGIETEPEQNTGYRCGLCGMPINVTIIVRNHFQEPYFEHQGMIKEQPQRPLLYFLQAAADMEPSTFKFSADYFGSLGFMITKIAGLGGSVEDKTYWKILKQPKGDTIEYESLMYGVSSFVPLHNDVIMFNFTTWEYEDGH